MLIAIFPNLPISPLLQDVILGAVLVIIVFIILLVIWRHRARKLHEEALARRYSYRIYTVDLDRNTVTLFDKSNPRDQRMTDLDHFLKQYDAEDYYRVQNWLRNLLDPKKMALWHLEAKAHIRRAKKTFFSVLEATKVERERKIIHLNSYILRYLSPKKGRVRRHSNVLTLQEANRHLEKTASNRGATYMIKFNYKKYQGNTGMFISSVFLKKLKDKITHFLSMGLFLVEHEGIEILLLETKNLTNNEHMQIAHSLAHTIVKNLEVSGLKDEVSFAIGVVENKYFPRQMEELLNHARLMADLAEKRGLVVSIYDRNQSDTEITAKAVDLEVVDILKSRKYEVRFRPVLNLHTYDALGYYCSIAIQSPLTSDRLELSRMAQESEASRELLSNIARLLLASFVEQRQDPNQLLFFPSSVYERNFIVKSLAMMKKAKEVRIVLVFDETEINDWEAPKEMLTTMIASLKEKGLGLAIAFTDMHLLLGNEIYNLFDYYILDHRLTGDLVGNDRQRFNFRSLVETLQQFHHPIIAIDMTELAGVELAANFAVDGVSADAVGPFVTRISPFETKTINRIRQFERGKKN